MLLITYILLKVAAKIGFYNARFHRRSKSANGRIIDHQSRHKIPEGTIMQPRNLKNCKQTVKPEASDLRKSIEYLLTHQEVDEEGNLSTHLIKVYMVSHSLKIISAE